MDKTDAHRHGGSTTPVPDEARSTPTDDALTRRTALKLISATALLAAGGACTRKPERKIVSVAEAPEYQKPGIALRYASTWTDGAWPYGIVVKAVDGRPVKIEGHPDHPLNRGTSDARMQASLLSLYDPERLRSPLAGGQAATWEEADRRVVEALKAASSVVVVTRALLGPSERALVERFCAVAPGGKHLVWESVHDGAQRRAWKEVYGRDGIVRPDLSRARVLVSLDCDFLGTDGETLGQIRDFAARRVVDGDPEAKRLSRLYVAESTMTTTGSNADHRLPVRPSATLGLALALRAALAGDPEPLGVWAEAQGADAEVLSALAADLRSARGEAVVLAGAHLPEAVHAQVAVLNEALAAPLSWIPYPPTLPGSTPAALAAALEGKPDVVLLLGVNPVHDLPGGAFAELLAGAKLTVGHGLTANETLASCRVALPSAHNVESWNDAAPLPGVQTLAQPLIAPLFGGRQEAHSLLRWAKALSPAEPLWKDAADWHDFVRRRWQQDVLVGASDAKRAWEDALRKGLVGTPETVAVPPADAQRAAALASRQRTALEGASYEVVLRPHPAVYDGRFAGNAWLQELPDPASRLVWDNAASVGPETARQLAVKEGDWIRVRVGDRSLEAPVLVQSGAAPGVVSLTLGHGRTQGAGVGDGVGVNAASLLGASTGLTPWLAVGAEVAKVGRKRYALVRTQETFDAHDRPFALSGTRDEYREDPAFVHHRLHVPELKQLDDEWDYSKGPKWGMAIDLSSCIGCGACTIACQAENNISVVGKDECALGREMSWIRIDRYEAGDPANPQVSQQPMLCQHCDNAPCENVCPVNATVHSPDGMNEQIYNRCVGTRYCANNCPYKVRRFNFFNYTKHAVRDPVGELLYNPQVTVRMRGVMEKCTWCVQRINAAEFAAQNEGRELGGDAIRTACQQACPAQAIHFGNLNDPESTVARKRASALGYHVLEELNVRPNVTYLARVRNPATGGKPGATQGGHR